MVGDILQPTHLLFILVVALLVLGPKRLPEVGRTLGTGLRDFKAAINGESTHHDDEDDDEPHGYVEPETTAGDTVEDEHDTLVRDQPEWEAETEVVSHGEDDPVDTTPVDANGATTTTADDVLSPPEPAAEPVPERTAKASSAGFASALAASRQQTGVDEPGDDE